MILSSLFLDDPAPYEILVGNCVETMRGLAAGSVQTCVTSPPYFGLRSYGGGDAEIGKEKTPAEFVTSLVAVFREVRRVLKDDGTVWLNLGNSYAQAGGRGEQGASSQRKGRANVKAQERSVTSTRPPEGYKTKDLIGVPWMVALALQADGWTLRQDIVWAKTNPMPESVRDRCTNSHEYIFLLSKGPRYFFDFEAMQEPAVYANCGRPSKKKGDFKGKTEEMADTGRNAFRAVTETRNKRSVWTVSSKPFKGAHFATFPPELITPCVLAGSRPGDLVLDPFGGSGTTAQVALQHGRRAVLCELNPDYVPLIHERISKISIAHFPVFP